MICSLLSRLVSLFRHLMYIAVVNFFKLLLEELRADPANQKSPLSSDGTVHEDTSKTFNACRRLLDYSQVIDQFFADGWVSSFVFLT
jgi:hypothetical protein